MDLPLIIKAYIHHLELNSYPAELVNRRQFTYRRFIDTYDEFNAESLIDFYSSHDFLRPHSHCLVLQDLLAWLRYMETEKLIDGSIYLALDRRTVEQME